MEYIQIINLEKYQHYKSGRNTTWIKWYFKSLQSYEFCQLSDSQRWLFVGLTMLAVQHDNKIPYDTLHIRNMVLQVDGKGVSKVRAGCEKMAKLGLIIIKNDSTERKERKNTVINTYFSSKTNLTTDKQSHTKEQWEIILQDWKRKGNHTFKGNKIVVKKDGSKWLVDINGNWQKFKIK